MKGAIRCMVVYTVRRRTTAHNDDGQGCAQTTTDQRGLLSTLLSSQPQRTSTTNLNREPLACGPCQAITRTNNNFHSKTSSTTTLTTTNEPMDCFTITSPHCLFKCWCFLVWERDNAVQVRMFFQLHPIRSENAVPSHYFFLTFMLHCKLFCIHTSINFVYLHLSSIPTAWQNKVNK